MEQANNQWIDKDWRTSRAIQRNYLQSSWTRRLYPSPARSEASWGPRIGKGMGLAIPTKGSAHVVQVLHGVVRQESRQATVNPKHCSFQYVVWCIFDRTIFFHQVLPVRCPRRLILFTAGFVPFATDVQQREGARNPGPPYKPPENGGRGRRNFEQVVMGFSVCPKWTH